MLWFNVLMADALDLVMKTDRPKKREPKEKMHPSFFFVKGGRSGVWALSSFNRRRGKNFSRDLIRPFISQHIQGSFGDTWTV